MRTSKERKTARAPWMEAFPEQVLHDQKVDRLAAQLRRKLKASRGKRIRSVSKRQSARLCEYRKRRDEWLAERRGWPCPVMGQMFTRLDFVTEVHHIRGRTGNLLMDERYWLGVSAEGHRWVHQHPRMAQWRGWLATAGEWGKQGANGSELQYDGDGDHY